jgi:hypothetical protein
MLTGLLSLLLVVNAVAGLAPSGPWDDFNYAPASRLVYPKNVYKTNGEVANAEGLVGDSNVGDYATIAGEDSFIALDFGLEVRVLYTNYSLLVTVISSTDRRTDIAKLWPFASFLRNQLRIQRIISICAPP